MVSVPGMQSEGQELSRTCNMFGYTGWIAGVVNIPHRINPGFNIMVGIHIAVVGAAVGHKGVAGLKLLQLHQPVIARINRTDLAYATQGDGGRAHVQDEKAVDDIHIEVEYTTPAPYVEFEVPGVDRIRGGDVA